MPGSLAHHPGSERRCVCFCVTSSCVLFPDTAVTDRGTLPSCALANPVASLALHYLAISLRTRVAAADANLAVAERFWGLAAGHNSYCRSFPSGGGMTDAHADLAKFS
jgi:hypothetical protein